MERLKKCKIKKDDFDICFWITDLKDCNNESVYNIFLFLSDMRRDVQEIFRATPHEKQVMMFSATLSKEIRPVCKKFMQDVRTSTIIIIQAAPPAGGWFKLHLWQKFPAADDGSWRRTDLLRHSSALTFKIFRLAKSLKICIKCHFKRHRQERRNSKEEKRRKKKRTNE